MKMISSKYPECCEGHVCDNNYCREIDQLNYIEKLVLEYVELNKIINRNPLRKNAFAELLALYSRLIRENKALYLNKY